MTSTVNHSLTQSVAFTRPNSLSQDNRQRAYVLIIIDCLIISRQFGDVHARCLLSCQSELGLVKAKEWVIVIDSVESNERIITDRQTGSRATVCVS